MSDRTLLVGVFVGGASRRMGGQPKGWLRAPGSDQEMRGGASIIERTLGLARDLAGEVVLVGQAAAYERLGARAIADAPGGEGPLAGLVALLAHAGDRRAIALACDMPYLSRAVLERLVTWAPEAVAVAPREGGGWSALLSRWDAARALDVARALLVEGGRGPSAALDAVGARELPLRDDERATLRDWDTPEDVVRDKG
jgi:molybdopterin-guanine dinucleotide biosynthesis protein A